MSFPHQEERNLQTHDSKERTMYAENKMSQIIESIHSLRMNLLGGSYKLELAARHLDSAASEICSFLHKTEEQPADTMPPKIAVEEKLPAPEDFPSDSHKNSCEIFISQWLARETDYPVCACSSGQIYTAYCAWCEKTGNYKNHMNFFGGFLRDTGFEYKRVRMSILAGDNKSIMERVFIPRDEFIDEQLKKRPHQAATHWITECYLAFGAYLKEAGLVQEG